jgi:hypothetical protein
MYQVTVYDNSGPRPRSVEKTIFANEECAWSWYDLKNNEKILKQKRIKLEFKILGDKS